MLVLLSRKQGQPPVWQLTLFLFQVALASLHNEGLSPFGDSWKGEQPFRVSPSIFNRLAEITAFNCNYNYYP